MGEIRKSPEEIKKGLECCGDVCFNDNESCPYNKDNLKENISCISWMAKDAFAYIRQLEADNAKKDETIQMLQNGNASLMNMIDEECEKTVRLELERDAAVTDLSCNWKCAICKNFVKPIDKCPYYRECGLCYTHFEWRGVSEKEE